MGDVISIEIPLYWMPVLVKGHHFPWHKNLPKTTQARDMISGPKVYRWVLRTKTGRVESIYIGQSEKFQERISAYRTGNQKALGSDKAVLANLGHCEDSGGAVELQFLDVDMGSFRIYGKLVNNSSLGDHDIRLMMESIAIVAARASNLKVLNRLRENAHLKEIAHLVKLTPKQVEQILQRSLTRGND